jgi:DNA (cytosine-5)-methyltransferase 1
MGKPTHFSLFTGIGGIDLAAEWAGFETVGQCEWADYPTKVLEKHWPDVPRWRDIRSVTKESFENITGLRTVDLISGGFPCQPFSTSGKQQGKDDDRYFWPEMFGIIREFKPHWVIAENVENAVRMVLDEVCDNLESINYQVWPIVVSAYCSGSWFDGKRTFILAASNDRSSAMRWNPQLQSDDQTDENRTDNRCGAPFIDARKRWQVEPRPYGVADGVSFRVDRLKCLGNAVVPQQVYPILKAIAELEVNL